MTVTEPPAADAPMRSHFGSNAQPSGWKSGKRDREIIEEMTDAQRVVQPRTSSSSSSGVKRSSENESVDVPEAKRRVIESSQEKRPLTRENPSGEHGSPKKTTKSTAAPSSSANVALDAMSRVETERALHNLSLILYELGASNVDVGEVFNPRIFTNAAPRYGLRPGTAFDLIMFNPHGEPSGF